MVVVLLLASYHTVRCFALRAQFGRPVSATLLPLSTPPTAPLTNNQAVAASTISAMKSNARANTQQDVNHLRQGGAGGWRNVFKVRESEAFDRLYLKQMEGSGLEMDFGEGLSM